MGSYNLILTALSSAQDLIPAPGSVEAARQRALGTGGAARRHQRPGLLWRCHARLGLRCHAGDFGWSGLSWDWVGIGLRSTFSLLLILGGVVIAVLVCISGRSCGCSWRFSSFFPLLIRFPYLLAMCGCFGWLLLGIHYQLLEWRMLKLMLWPGIICTLIGFWTCVNQEIVRIQMIVFWRSRHIWFIYLLKGYLVGTHRVAWSCWYCFIIFFPFYQPA